MRQRLERWLHSVWYDNARSGLILRPLSWLYGGTMMLRALTYRRGWRRTYRAAVPVIVVGNITAGGVGKTPLVVWLVEWLQQRGYTPGVITRGYGGSISESTTVTPSHTPGETGDEALMLARRLSVPVVVGKNRCASVAMLESEVDIVVADDGLQHYKLERDIEICVIDEQRLFGNQQLLPGGPLREPVERLNSCDLVVHHRQNLEKEDSGMMLGNARLRRMTDNLELPLSALEGRAVHAVAGVGNPARFFTSLERAGLSIKAHSFADHHSFVCQDLEFGDGQPVVMTDKDAVKCESFAKDYFYSVRVDALVSIDVENTLHKKLEALGAHAAR